MTKRLFSLLLAVFIILSAFSGCANSNKLSAIPDMKDAPLIKAGLLFDSSSGDESYLDTLTLLKQTLLLSFSVSPLDVAKENDIEDFDILYLDSSLVGSKKMETLSKEIISFTEKGGSVMMPNGFYDSFPAKFLGAKSFVSSKGKPGSLEFPKVPKNYQELQELLKTFSKAYDSMAENRLLSSPDFGFLSIPDTAVPLVTSEQGALYTMNKYGKGLVFFTSPILPSSLCTADFLTEDHDAEDFAHALASAHQMLFNCFAGCHSKMVYGLAAYRVFGTFGSPGMSWILPISDTEDIVGEPALLFGKTAKEYGQYPSFALSRRVGDHNLSAESVSFLLSEQTQDGFGFVPDFHESSYTDGIHAALSDRWLTLNSAPKIKDAFPELCTSVVTDDIAGDGNFDLILGSSDGYIYLCEGLGLDENIKCKEPVKIKDSQGNELKVDSYSIPLIFDMDRDGVKDLVCGSKGGTIYIAKGMGGGKFSPFEELIKTPIKELCFPDIGDLDGDGVPDLIIGSSEGRLIVYYGQIGTSEIFEQGLYTELSENFSALGRFLAPRLCDIDNDGQKELIIGTLEGYIAVAEISGGLPQMDRFISSQELNVYGNHNLVFGHYCVPYCADLNKDGKNDLICGSVEDGIIYPAESPYFPHQEELSSQLKNLMDEGFDLVPGFSHPSDSYMKHDEGEGFHLGDIILPLSFSSGDLCMLSGGLASNPRVDLGDVRIMNSGSSSGISLPFLIKDEDKNSALIVESISPESEIASLSAEFKLPLCFAESPAKLGKDKETAKKALIDIGKLAFENHYNFQSARQLALSMASSYALSLNISSGEDKNQFIFTPEFPKDGPLFESGYAASCGIRISLGEALADENFLCTASSWYREGDNIYASCDKPFTIYETLFSRNPPHIESINTAAEISPLDGGIKVEFKDDGLLTCIIDGDASTNSTGWEIEKVGDKTIFSTYKQTNVLNILW